MSRDVTPRFMEDLAALRSDIILYGFVEVFLKAPLKKQGAEKRGELRRLLRKPPPSHPRLLKNLVKWVVWLHVTEMRQLSYGRCQRNLTLCASASLREIKKAASRKGYWPSANWRSGWPGGPTAPPTE